MLSDCNTKPLTGETLAALFHRAIGVRFYPPKSSRHYSDMDLDAF
jgi:hypothetical protein